MKTTHVSIFMLAVLCCIAFGCAPTAKNATKSVAGTTKHIVDTTYNAIEKADDWIEEKMW